MKLIKAAQVNVSYTAIVSPESVADGFMSPWDLLVSSLEIPEGWSIHAHHLTLNMGACKDKSLLGKNVQLKATALGRDENAMALLVETPVPTKNKLPHITIAVAPGAKPVQSNDIKEWKKLDHPISLNGTVAEVLQGGKLAPFEMIPGGLSSGKNPNDFDTKALEAGVKIEMEHVKGPGVSPEVAKRIATEIAMDHLTEDPQYYDKLNDAGL